MTDRARFLLLGAAVVGPLALFPVLIVQPVLGIAAAMAVVVALLASRSVAFPVALAGLPDIVIGLKGSDPFPPKVSIYFTTGWTLLAIFVALLRHEDVLPFRILSSPPVVLTLAFVGLMVIRLGASQVPQYGSYKVQLFLAKAVILLFAGIVIAKARKHFDLWLLLALVMSALGGLTLVRSIVQGDANQTYVGRYALFADASPIELGREAAFGLLVGVYVLIAAGAFWRRMIALAAVPVLAVTLLAAGSRGPTLGLVVGILLLFGLTMSEAGARRRLLLVGVVAILAAALVPELVPGQSLNRSLSILLGGDTQGHGGLDANGRFSLWSTGWNAFAQHPLFGIGTGSFPAISPNGDFYPHNIVLEGAAEEGILGGLLIGAFIFFAVRGPLRLWRRASGVERSHSALVLALLGMSLVNAFVSGTFENSQLVWLAAGLGIGLTEGPHASALRFGLMWRRTRAEKEGVDSQFAKASPAGMRAGSAPTSGAITSPAPGSVVRGKVRVAAVPAETGWSVASLTIECSIDGREWTEIGAASADDSYDVFLVSRGVGVRRRHVAVVRTLERAEQMKQVLESEHAGGPEQVELAPSKRKPWTAGESHGAEWDTSLLEDGSYRLRAVTTDIASHRASSPEVSVTVDNAAPSVSLDSPEHGATISGVVQLLATASDRASGIAAVRFELGRQSEWVEIGSVAHAPYGGRWDPTELPDGEYELRAVAVDAAGNETYSEPVPVWIGEYDFAESVPAPIEDRDGEEQATARIERLAYGEPVALAELPATISRDLELRVILGGEPGVEWVAYQASSADSFSWQTLGQVDQPPFTLALDTSLLPDGIYDFRVLASCGGRVDCSRALRGRRIDNTQPSAAEAEPWPLVGANGSNGDHLVPADVRLVEPTGGSVVAGTIRVEAEARDAASVSFECSLDGRDWTPLGSLVEQPFAIGWDTHAGVDGLYWLRCVARDAAGLATESPVVYVHVANGSPLATPPETLDHPTGVPSEATSGEPATLWDLQRLLDTAAPDDPRRVEQAALLQVLRGVAPADGRIPHHFRALVFDTFGERRLP